MALFDSVTVLVGNGDPLVSLVSGNKSDRKLYSSRCEKDSPLVVLYTLWWSDEDYKLYCVLMDVYIIPDSDEVAWFG